MEKQNKSADKITDKAFSRLMLTSVLGILVCIMCLCSATWAWFSTDISNDSNTLGTGKFGLCVAITDANGASVTISERDDGTSVCTLGEAGQYTVTLTMTEDTTVTKGFCSIKVAGRSYQTASITVEGTNPFVFTLDAAKDGMTVTLSPAWGLPANADVEYGGTLVIGAAAGDEN